eukprot:TRINITY_DN7463_c0_g4_i2.p1 TRINITY_DN7463_c0_g4~~TRINITY_DN7463_c0_g4_i2.p1  ORF type:complete len:297 (+),score=36.94 TRINITY_DN7463_c0_g4_i2:28-891(+)
MEGAGDVAGRIQQWFREIAIVTKSVMVICSSVFIVMIMIGFSSTLQNVCVSARFVWQLHRIFAAPVVHLSVMHLLFNMMAFLPMSRTMERSLGSIQYLWALLFLIAAIGVTHLSLAFVISSNPIYQFSSFYYDCSAGLSAVIFALLVIYANSSANQQFSIFGFFQVPAKIYPWVLLLVIQLLMPGVSLLGHLSGILVGYLYTSPVGEYITLSDDRIISLQQSVVFARLSTRDDFALGGYSGSGLPVTASSTTTATTTGAASTTDAALNVRGSTVAAFSGAGHVLGSS